jgi:hypothetical protein
VAGDPSTPLGTSERPDGKKMGGGGCTPLVVWEKAL